MSRLQDVILRGTRATQPLFSAVAPGTLYYVTDEYKIERCADDNLSWQSYSGSLGGSSSGLPGLDGQDGESPFVFIPNIKNPIIFDLTLTANTLIIDTGAAGIPPGFNVLEVFIIARSNEAVVGSQLDVVVNADTGNNYDREFVRGDNVTASASNGNAQPNWPIVIAGASCAAGVFSYLNITLPFYAQTTAFKTGALQHIRVDTTVANSRAELQGLLWRSTAAITRLSISAPAANLLLAGSRMLIFGR